MFRGMGFGLLRCEVLGRWVWGEELYGLRV
jgi:hypothetical protein